MPEVVKYIETHYPVIAAKSGRAIAGLSLGGLHTLFISANNPKAFDYVGLFSAQTTNTITSRRKIGRIERLALTIDKISDTFPFLAQEERVRELTAMPVSLVRAGWRSTTVSTISSASSSTTSQSSITSLTEETIS